MAKVNKVNATATNATVGAMRTIGAATFAVAANRTSAQPVANAHKYGTTAKAIPAGIAAAQYKLTAYGLAQAQAAMAGGKVTVMGIVALAAMRAGATQSQAVSGLQVVLAMRTAKQAVQAYGATKAGKYAPQGTLPCPAWCAGYVNGAANANKGGILAKQ